jgi:hypothetical protein
MADERAGLDELRRQGWGRSAGEAGRKPEEPQEEPVGDGMSAARGALAGVALEMPSGDTEGIYYAAILGRIRHDPSKGVSFVFEDADGLWKVEIAGNNLFALARELRLCRRDTVRVNGDTVLGISIVPYVPQPRPR